MPRSLSETMFGFKLLGFCSMSLQLFSETYRVLDLNHQNDASIVGSYISMGEGLFSLKPEVCTIQHGEW